MGYNTHLAKISSAGQLIRVGKINLLRARGEERRGEGRRGEQRERRIIMHTLPTSHLARQGLCNRREHGEFALYIVTGIQSNFGGELKISSVQL